MSENKNIKIFNNIGNTAVKAALVSVILDGADEKAAETSLAELERLLETAGGETFGQLTQHRDTPDIRTYIGSGKLKELNEITKNNGIELVIFDAELSPTQIKNLEDELDGGVRVIDRSMLILDIFALHAVTSEGKVQVELAQMKYTAPRLTGKGLQLSRQQGGNIAMRGPGETKLETDRRHLKRRIHALETKLEEIEKNREIQREHRIRTGIVKAAVVGYTNAGKSTLVNYMTGAGILAEDKLFATLDPTTRKFTLPNGNEILITDTVGFIRNLPHHLIEAFKSTLEEVTGADIIIIMTDASDPECDSQLEVTMDLLNELGAGGKPILYVYNKCDLIDGFYSDSGDKIYISAKNGYGIEKLVKRLEELAAARKTEETFVIPNTEMAVIDRLYKEAAVQNVEYGDEYVTVKAIADAKTKGSLKNYRR